MPGPRSATLAAVLGASLLLGGCAGTVVPGQAVVAQVPRTDLALIHTYVDGLNRSGQAGVDAQARFLHDTQDPDSPPLRPGCLGKVTLETRIVDRTVRPDDAFLAPRTRGAPARPAGAVYVVAVGVSTSQDGVVTREEIGSKHLVVRDGRVYGYVQCPR